MSQALLNYFKKYLTADKKIGSASTKNYVSDINLFLNWVSRTLQEENIQAEHLTPTIVKTYQKHLTQNVHPTTAQRHLSSLRRFGEFLVNTNRLTADPTKSLTPLPA
ncbi:MAG: site-specific integrase [Candidatus Beckwithbacteria bacterium]|nr:site-specific integrase [Candidatus Beckwithbacteria bacterium]